MRERQAPGAIVLAIMPRPTASGNRHRHPRRRRSPARRRRLARPSEGAGGPVPDRDLGADELLRHALAARAVHGQAPARPARRRRRGARLQCPQARARDRLRRADAAGAVVADLRPLHRLRLPHAVLRRHARRPRARAQEGGRRRRCLHGDRPLPDGERAAVPGRADVPDRRQRLLQAEHLDPGRRPLRAGRSAPRPRLFGLLRRRQPRRLHRAADLRHARPGRRLALRLRRRRRRHGARAGHLPDEPGQAALRSAAGDVTGDAGWPRPRRSCSACRSASSCCSGC